MPRRFSDEECFDNLLKVWTFRGRVPRLEDMARPPSTVGIRPYVTRWRTWRKALKAFVDRANSDAAASANQTVTLATPPDAIEPPTRVNSSSGSAGDQRSIGVGLRYLVLKRDRFRCVVCGRSPAATPGLELHIDHILPFARGGKTVADNLRSTCRDCNLGKGVRLES